MLYQKLLFEFNRKHLNHFQFWNEILEKIFLSSMIAKFN